jgi:magnesium transporter
VPAGGGEALAISTERRDRGPKGEPSRTGTLRAFLYDAGGTDREVDLDEVSLDQVGKREILWIDAASMEDDITSELWQMLGFDEGTVDRAMRPAQRPSIEAFDSYFRVSLVVVDERNDTYEPVGLRALAGDRWIVTIHPPEFDLVESFNEPLKGETALGEMDGARFLAPLLNWLLNGYFHVVDELEEEVDDLDEKLLTKELEEDELLARLLQSRRRITRLRRMLGPHRDVISMLAQPDSKLFTNSDHSAESYQRLHERLETAMEAIDDVREMLIGSFEVFMTQTAQRTNEVMKILTVVSVLLLPAVVVAGVMGMNFKVGFFQHPGYFWVTIASMGLLAVVTLAIARWRDWI